MYGGHQRLRTLFVWPKLFRQQICRADHLRFALFIYAKHTIKREKSQSRSRATSLQPSLWIAFTQATFPRPNPWTPSASQARHLPRARGRGASSHSHVFCLSKSASCCALGMICVPSTSVRSKTLDPLGGYFDFFWKSVS